MECVGLCERSVFLSPAGGKSCADEEVGAAEIILCDVHRPGVDVDAGLFLWLHFYLIRSKIALAITGKGRAKFILC